MIILIPIAQFMLGMCSFSVICELLGCFCKLKVDIVKWKRKRGIVPGNCGFSLLSRTNFVN